MDVNRKPDYLTLDVPIDFKTDERKSFRCPQCKYVTDRKNNLKRHIITMHQESSKSLECCGVLFKSKALLRDHVSLFHRGGYCCQICGRNFCRKALLHRHLTVHSGQKDFSCSQCGYATSHKSNLERHQKVHLRCGDGSHNPFDHSSDEDRCNTFLTESRSGSIRRTRFSKKLYRHLLLPKRLAHTHHSVPNSGNDSSKQNSCDHMPDCNDGGSKMEQDTDVSKTTVNDQFSKDSKLPPERYSWNRLGNSKRMLHRAYKCNVCNRHFKYQLEFFRHQCLSRERHQPTLPFTTARKRTKFGTKQGKELDSVQESSVLPKSPKNSGVLEADSKYRKKRLNDFRFSNTCAQKVSRADDSYRSLNCSKFFNHTSRTLHEKIKTKNEEFQDSSFTKPLKKYGAFPNKDFMNLYQIPSKQVSDPVHYYPYSPFPNDNVKNVDFWRVW